MRTGLVLTTVRLLSTITSVCSVLSERLFVAERDHGIDLRGSVGR